MPAPALNLLRAKLVLTSKDICPPAVYAQTLHRFPDALSKRWFADIATAEDEVDRAELPAELSAKHDDGGSAAGRPEAAVAVVQGAAEATAKPATAQAEIVDLTGGDDEDSDDDKSSEDEDEEDASQVRKRRRIGQLSSMQRHRLIRRTVVGSVEESEDSSGGELSSEEGEEKAASNQPEDDDKGDEVSETDVESSTSSGSPGPTFVVFDTVGWVFRETATRADAIRRSTEPAVRAGNGVEIYINDIANAELTKALGIQPKRRAMQFATQATESEEVALLEREEKKLWDWAKEWGAREEGSGEQPMGRSPLWFVLRRRLWEMFVAEKRMQEE